MPFDAAWIAIIFCGVPIIIEAFIGLVTEFDIKADVLVSIALIAAVIIHEDFAAGEVAFIMQLGGLLEDLTVAKARGGIEKLVSLTPRTARIIKQINDVENEIVIPAERVKIGDRIRVLAGETIPVDGIILSGQTSVNQAAMTGESLPVDKSEGDEVSSGTVNQFGIFDMEAVKVGEDSSIQRMIRLVQSADARKAKIVGLADRWATWVVIIALSAAMITYFATHEILRSVTILVVFCPCALVLATPTAIMAAIGNATKHGFLVREGDALERLASVKKIIFDKTGTLTYGLLKVIAVVPVNNKYSEKELYCFAAMGESKSEPPLGKAIVACYKETYHEIINVPEQFMLLPGRGIESKVNEFMLAAGNLKLMEEKKIDITQAKKAACEYQEKGSTIIYIAIDGSLAGFLALSDTLRSDSPDMVGKIQKTGITPVLLTGDNREAANTISKQLGISEIKYDCLPEDKLKQIAEYEKNNQLVCMVGDGINDAPALKKAHVGIAMGGIGSDIAVDAADIVLVNDDIKELPHLLNLAKRMLKAIKLNLTFSMTLNFVAIVMAITGVLNPVAGALVHNSGSVLVIINSALLLRWRKKI